MIELQTGTKNVGLVINGETTNFGRVTREGKFLDYKFFKVCEYDVLVFEGITDTFDFRICGGA